MRSPFIYTGLICLPIGKAPTVDRDIFHISATSRATPQKNIEQCCWYRKRARYVDFKPADQTTSGVKAAGQHIKMSQRELKSGGRMVKSVVFVKQHLKVPEMSLADWKHKDLKPAEVSCRRYYSKRGSEASCALLPKYHR
jgi:hypothetical protein